MQTHIWYPVHLLLKRVTGKLRMLWTSQWKEGRKEGNEQSGGDSLGNTSFKEAYPCPLWPISTAEGEQFVFFFFTDTHGISQTQAFKTDFQNRPWRCQRTDLTGIINHLGKQNLNLRDKAADKKGILYGKLLDMGVKHPYRLWQENKSCHQEQFAGKGKLRRTEQGSQKCRRVSQVGRRSMIWARPPTQRARHTRYPEGSNGDLAQNQMSGLTESNIRGLLSECWAVTWQSGTRDWEAWPFKFRYVTAE